MIDTESDTGQKEEPDSRRSPISPVSDPSSLVNDLPTRLTRLYPDLEVESSYFLRWLVYSEPGSRNQLCFFFRLDPEKVTGPNVDEKCLRKRSLLKVDRCLGDFGV